MSDGVRPLEGRNSARAFDEHRDLLISVAYRVLGSVTDAEDTVQEAWLRWCKVDPAEVSTPRAFLVRVTTRFAIDRLRRAKARRSRSMASRVVTRTRKARGVEISAGSTLHQRSQASCTVSSASVTLPRTR